MKPRAAKYADAGQQLEAGVGEADDELPDPVMSLRRTGVGGEVIMMPKPSPARRRSARRPRSTRWLAERAPVGAEQGVEAARRRRASGRRPSAMTATTGPAMTTATRRCPPDAERHDRERRPPTGATSGTVTAADEVEADAGVAAKVGVEQEASGRRPPVEGAERVARRPRDDGGVVDRDHEADPHLARRAPPPRRPGEAAVGPRRLSPA